MIIVFKGVLSWLFWTAILWLMVLGSCKAVLGQTRPPRPPIVHIPPPARTWTRQVGVRFQIPEHKPIRIPIRRVPVWFFRRFKAQ